MSDTKNPEEVTEIISDVAEKVGEMTDKIADKADNLIDKAAGLKDDIADKTAEIADRLADKTDAVKDIVAEVADKAADAAESVPDKVDNYADKSLAELSQMFENLKGSVDSMSRSKEAESIKASFYKLLSKLKAERGESDGEDKEEGINSPFETVEQNFKAFFFYCYGDHRDLHSFPTRRSSDLLLSFKPTFKESSADRSRPALDFQYAGV